MIKILHRPLEKRTVVNEAGEEEQVKNEPVVSYAIRDDATGLTISFLAKHCGCKVSRDVRLAYEQYAGKVIQIALITTDALHDLKVYPIFDLVNNLTFLQNRTISSPDISIARVVFNEDCSEIVVLLSKDSDDIPSYPNFTYDKHTFSATGFLAEHSVYFSKLLDKRKAKAEMMNALDIYASIAYLESQVDALTRVVKSLAPEKTELRQILDAADQYSVLDMKSADAIIREFAGDKQKVRAMQGGYYRAKGKF